MPRLDTVWVVLLAMPAVVSANPDSIRNHREARTEQRQLAVDRDWNERDARELGEFERLAIALRDASRDRMTGRYREVNARLEAAMTREIEQAQVKSAQAAQEARLSLDESRAGRMDASVSGDLFPLPDHRDDARDHDHTLARYEEMVRIGTMSTALQNRIEHGDRTAMKRNIQLAENFLALMRRDLAATQAEMSEDRADQRDRR